MWKILSIQQPDPESAPETYLGLGVYIILRRNVSHLVIKKQPAGAGWIFLFTNDIFECLNDRTIHALDDPAHDLYHENNDNC